MKIKYSTRFTCFGKTTARSFNIGCYPAAVKQGSKVDLERGNFKLHEVLEKGEFHEALLAWRGTKSPEAPILKKHPYLAWKFLNASLNS
jgi:hypothetical protein